MANERRVRGNYSFGTVPGGLGAADTQISSAGFAGLPVIDNYSHAALTLYSPATSAYEIVYVTAHAAGATTATIVRGREGTTAQAWLANTPWLHGPTARDLVLAGNPRTLYFDDCDSALLPDGASVDTPANLAFNSQYRRRELTAPINYISAPFVLPSHAIWVDVETTRENVYSNGTLSVAFWRGGVGIAGTRVGLMTSQQADNNDVIYFGNGTTTGTAASANQKVGRFKQRFLIDPLNNAWDASIEYNLGTSGPLRGRFTPNPTVAAGDVVQVVVSASNTASVGLLRAAVTA
jgi:hypothetical protein